MKELQAKTLTEMPGSHPGPHLRVVYGFIPEMLRRIFFWKMYKRNASANALYVCTVVMPGKAIMASIKCKKPLGLCDFVLKRGGKFCVFVLD